jgi:hypothetical protein
MEGDFPRGRRKRCRSEAPHLLHELGQTGFGIESAPANKRAPLHGSGGVYAESFGQSYGGRVDGAAAISKGRTNGFRQMIAVKRLQTRQQGEIVIVLDAAVD